MRVAQERIRIRGPEQSADGERSRRLSKDHTAASAEDDPVRKTLCGTSRQGVSHPGGGFGSMAAPCGGGGALMAPPPLSSDFALSYASMGGFTKQHIVADHKGFLACGFTNKEKTGDKVQ